MTFWDYRFGLAPPRLRAEELVPGVFQLEVWAANVFLIVEERVTLIDCGLRGSASFILEFLHRIGRSPQDIGLILITHHHYDHIGELVRMRGLSGARVAIHGADIPDGLPYPAPASWLLQYPVLSAMKRLLVVESHYLDIPLYGGEELAPLGGLRVIHTPGHTLGSVCFYSPRHRLLLVGDALNHRHQRLFPPPRITCVDPEQARDSIARMAALSFEVIGFGHGQPMREGGREQVLALTAALSPGTGRR